MTVSIKRLWIYAASWAAAQAMVGYLRDTFWDTSAPIMIGGLSLAFCITGMTLISESRASRKQLTKKDQEGTLS